MPDRAAVALGDVVGVAVGVGTAESLADGEALALGAGVGLLADAAAQPVRTTAIALAAPSKAIRNDMVM